MFPSCTCTVHRWEQPTASCRVKPHCMCQGREQHPMRMQNKPMGHRTQFVMALFCQLLKQQNITTISVFSVLSGRRAKRWATSQSTFRCVYCWLLRFFVFCLFFFAFPKSLSSRGWRKCFGWLTPALHQQHAAPAAQAMLYLKQAFPCKFPEKKIKTENSIRSTENMFSVLFFFFFPIIHSLYFTMYPCAIFCLSVLESPCSQLRSGPKT